MNEELLARAGDALGATDVDAVVAYGNLRGDRDLDLWVEGSRAAADAVAAAVAAVLPGIRLDLAGPWQSPADRELVRAGRWSARDGVVLAGAAVSAPVGMTAGDAVAIYQDRARNAAGELLERSIFLERLDAPASAHYRTEALRQWARSLATTPRQWRWANRASAAELQRSGVASIEPEKRKVTGSTPVSTTSTAARMPQNGHPRLVSGRSWAPRR